MKHESESFDELYSSETFPDKENWRTFELFAAREGLSLPWLERRLSLSLRPLILQIRRHWGWPTDASHSLDRAAKAAVDEAVFQGSRFLLLDAMGNRRLGKFSLLTTDRWCRSFQGELLPLMERKKQKLYWLGTGQVQSIFFLLVTQILVQTNIYFDNTQFPWKFHSHETGQR